MKSNIRNLRHEKNITQTTLAKVLGKTQQTVSHMEKDRNRIPVESLITIADYFGVSTDCVLGIEPEENKNEKGKGGTLSDTDVFRKEMEWLKNNSAGGSRKILYQLILSLLLYSLDDDPRENMEIQESHA